jgi:hypothetical protein
MMETVPGLDPNEMVIDLGYGLSPELISPHLLAARAHGGAKTSHSGMRRPGRSTSRGTPLVRALAPHGVSDKVGSHLGSTLNPGRAVLTLGVSRRSRSVAYVRADASPSEVLALAIVPLDGAIVNSTR